MNKISTLQGHVVVLVGSYTRQNLQLLFENKNIKRSHYLLKDWLTYPEKNVRYRAELELREKNNLGHFVRPANLFELVRFALLRPSLILNYGPVEGYDPYLETMGKELGLPLTVPFVTYSGGKIEVSLDNNNRRGESVCSLVVTHEQII